MAQVAQLYVAGKYTDGSGVTIAPVISPVNGDHLADLPVPFRRNSMTRLVQRAEPSRSTATEASTGRCGQRIAASMCRPLSDRVCLGREP